MSLLKPLININLTNFLRTFEPIFLFSSMIHPKIQGFNRFSMDGGFKSFSDEQNL